LPGEAVLLNYWPGRLVVLAPNALNTRFIEIPSFKNATWISPEGISMLTARAKYIARKGRACKAINGYRRLLKERAEGLL
jgi:hypothetical protein